jgi:hypothetical protein
MDIKMWNNAILVSNVVIFFVLTHYFHVNLFLLIGVIVPLDIIALTVFTIFFNFRKDLKPEPVPRGAFDQRRNDLDMDKATLDRMGFEKIDEFLLKIIPDVVVYLFRHREVPVYYCLYHMGAKKMWETVSLFDQDVSLTTSMSGDSGNIPLPPTSLLQVFPDASLQLVLEAHSQAIQFLASRGYRPVEHSASQFREDFMTAYWKTEQRIMSTPIWPVMLVIWVIINRGKMYAKPIEAQYRDGMIKTG